MAQNNNVKYSFNLFDSLDYGGTSAPKFEPEYEPYKEPSRKKANVKAAAPKKAKAEKTAKMTKAQSEQAVFNRILFALGATVAVIFVSLFACMLALNGQIDAKTTEIGIVQTKINEAKSEQTRLEAELDAAVSIDKIDDYALNVLGMIKLEDYKITYIGDQQENQVVISGGKSYSNPVTTKFLQLKEYFAD